METISAEELLRAFECNVFKGVDLQAIALGNEDEQRINRLEQVERLFGVQTNGLWAMRQAGVENQKDSNDPLDLLPLNDWADQIEALMPYYPCLREVCHGVPRKAWPAAVFVAAACYDTLMTRCTYHYYFQPSKERRLNYGIYIVGVPASGKSFAVQLL